MIKKTVSINSINKVKEFVDITSKTNLDVDLSTGRYVIDAKSIMGVFSLDLSKNISLCIHADECDEANEYLNAISKFIVE